MKNGDFSRCLPMIRRPRSRYIALWSMARLLAESIQANGLDHLLPQGVYSKPWPCWMVITHLTIFRALTHQHGNMRLKVYVNGDGADVYQDSVLKLAKSSDGVFTPTLILVGIRLGIDRITPVYWDALKSLLQMPQSIGIAGGRPSSSHYFFGIQGDQFFYLDPHVTRPALHYHADPTDMSEDEVGLCHTRRLRRLPLKEMDPSMLIAFVIKDEEEWRSWRNTISRTSGKPVVHVADEEPSLHVQGLERSDALHEVDTFDDEDDDYEGDGEIIERP